MKKRLINILFVFVGILCSSNVHSNGDVYVSDADISKGPLIEELSAGTNIIFTILNPGKNEILQITAQDDAAAVWGSITGVLSDQLDLQSALDLKANLDGSSLTNTSVNGVVLTPGGVATNYLDETGNYSIPPSASGTVTSVSGGTNINATGTATDPIINLDAAITGTSVNGVTLTALGVSTNFLNETGGYTVPPIAPVDSVFGRTGNVVSAPSDYDASQVDNDSLVTGIFVSDALNQLNTDIGNRVDSVSGGSNISVTGTATDPVVNLSSGIALSSIILTNSGSGILSALRISSPTPALEIRQTGGALDNKSWDTVASGEQLRFRVINDASTLSNNYMEVDRTGIVVDSVTFPGTTVTISGTATATSFNGVALTTGGSATSFLDETGNYSVPSGAGTVTSVSGGTNVNVTGTAADPIVNLDAVITGTSVNGVSLTTSGAVTSFLNETGGYSVPAGNGGQVNSVVSGNNITIDATDPINPIANLNSAITGTSVNGVTLTALGSSANFLNETGTYAIPPIAPVDSVFGRTGAVISAPSDYDASQVDNDSLVIGAFVSDALDTLDTALGTLVDSVNSGTNITIDNADPQNPIINLDSAITGTSVNSVTLTAAGAVTNFLNETGGYSVPAGSGGTVDSVSGGTNVNVTGTAVDPIVNLDAAITGTSVNGVTLTTGGIGTNFLNETGSYAAPLVATPGGTNSQFQFNNSGVFGGATGITYDGNNLNLADSNNIQIGTGNDFIIQHTGVASNIINTTGALTIQNSVGANSDITILNSGTTAKIINRLATATNLTSFVVEDNLGVDLFTVDGAGAILAGAINGVILTAGGVATNFLNEAGAYSVPPATGGTVTSVSGGTNVNVTGTATDPIVNLDAAITGTSVNGVTLNAAGAATNFLDETGSYSVPAGGGGGGQVDTVSGGTNVNVTGTASDPIVNLDAAVSTTSIVLTATGAGPNAALLVSSANPAFGLEETSQPADEKRWDWNAVNSQLRFRVVSDDGFDSNHWMEVNRTGFVVDSVIFPGTTVNISGDLNIPDSSMINLGADNDFQLVHTGTISRILNNTGNFVIENQGVTESIIFQLGTDTSSTTFEVQNNSGVGQFIVDGAGDATLTGDLTVSGTSQLAGNVAINSSPQSTVALHVQPGSTDDAIIARVSTNSSNNFEGRNAAGTQTFGVNGSGVVSLTNTLDLPDSVSARFGTGNDFTINHNGTNTQLLNNMGTFQFIQNGTGDILLQNNVATTDIRMQLGTTTNATQFVVNNSSSLALFSVDGAGVLNTSGLQVSGNLASVGQVSLFTADARLHIMTGSNDSIKVLRMQNGGVNGGDITFRTTTVDPDGDEPGDPGSIFWRESGINSGIYIQKSASAGTVWEKVATEDVLTLRSRNTFTASINTFTLGHPQIAAKTGGTIMTLTLSTTTLNLGSSTKAFEMTYQNETADAGTVTIDTQGAELINGAATTTNSTAYGSITLYSNGVNWTIKNAI